MQVFLNTFLCSRSIFITTKFFSDVDSDRNSYQRDFRHNAELVRKYVEYWKDIAFLDLMKKTRGALYIALRHTDALSTQPGDSQDLKGLEYRG